MLAAASGKLHAVEESRQAALHDPLTGLANRSLILDHLQLALARASRRSTLAAVIVLDLDDFNRVGTVPCQVGVRSEVGRRQSAEVSRRCSGPW